MYNNIPAELRQLDQWIVWASVMKDGKPTKIPINAQSLQPADITNPVNFSTFAHVVNTVQTVPGLAGIGLVLTANDPLVCIDLDNKPDNPASEHEQENHRAILDAFHARGTYIEASPSGTGWHIWAKGKLPPGCTKRRGHVEIYDDARFIACTGKVAVPYSGVIECPDLITDLAQSMGQGHAPINGTYTLDQIDSGLSDAQVATSILAAGQGGKFISLCKGEWRAMGYPSQSEADFALLSILAFYTVDNAQVRRMFRDTALGQRPKAQRNDYLDRSLGTIRARAGALSAEQHAVAKATAQAIAADAAARQEVNNSTNEIAFPPGLMGEVAQHFFDTAQRPVREVALAGAFCFFAGILGRCFNTYTGSGLNMYMLIVAKTGTGKEGAQHGISRLINQLRPYVPGIVDFMGPGEFSSGQAVIRTLDEHPCFVSVLGEFGLTLKQLNDPHAGAHIVKLRKALLDLFGKSGWEDILNPTAYSDSTKNTKLVQAPCITLLGESTPESLYDNIDPSSIADGLLPRFHIVEYRGERPATNPHANRRPAEALLKRIAEVVAVAIALKQQNKCITVEAVPEARKLLNDYDVACDRLIKDSASQGERDLWNRNHIKAVREAALISVVNNPHAPGISLDAATYATSFVHRDTQGLVDRFFAGDVGQGENKQHADLRRVIIEYFNMPARTLAHYRATPEMRTAGLIPYSYLVTRCTRIASFYKDRMGAVHALKNALTTKLETENLGRMDPASAFAQHGKREALYFRGNNW